MTEKVVLAVRIPPEHDKALRRAAKQDGRPFPEFLRELVREWAREAPKEPQKRP